MIVTAELIETAPPITAKARRVALLKRPSKAAQKAKRRYREKHPDRVKASWDAWKAKPENVAAARARAAKWAEENRERVRVKQRLFMRAKRAAARAAGK